MTRRARWLACTALTVATGPMLAGPIALAADWDGSTSTNWFAGTNWSTNAVPTAADAVNVDTVTPNPTVISGGAATSAATQIGGAAGTTGQVTVTGAGSSWTTANDILVGFLGSGSLTVQNGGTVTANIVQPGNATGSTGVVTVTGAGSTLTGSVFNIAGTGTLNILNGGKVTSAPGNSAGLGILNPSNGFATVDGAGSVWDTGSANRLILGIGGNATLTVSNGGVVNAGGGVEMANQSTSTATATVTGAGSAINSAGPFTVGGLLGAGTATLTVANGGVVNTSDITLANAVGSTGTLNIGSASGAAAAAPGTVNAATVAFGAGTGRIVFNHTASSFAFAPLISGAGTVSVEAGTTSLTSASTYTGNTTVSGGTLLVNGSIASSALTTVTAGGMLGGTGTVGNTTIDGGILAPGNSIGAIAINGNLIFGAGGIYRVEVTGTAADRTNVTGTATLGGASVQVVPTARITSTTTYTILSAAPVSGTFGSATLANNFARNARLSYIGNDVLLTLDPGLIAPALVGGTANQRSVAGGIDNAVGSGNPMSGFDALFALSSPALNGALDQLSGEVHASTVGVLADESLYARSAILGRLRQASYGNTAGMAALRLAGPQTAFADDGSGAIESALAFAKSPIVTKAPIKAPTASPDVVFWAQGFGAWGRFNGDGNAASVRRDLAGVMTGIDTRVGGNGRLGIAAGYTGSRNALDGRGSSTVETGHVAGYGGWSLGAINLRAGGAYAFHSIDTDRTVAFPGFSDRLTARYDGATGQVFGEVGYGFALGTFAVEPFAGAAWVRVNADAAAERGGVAALNVAGTTFETGYTTLGIRAADIIPIAADMMLVPRGSLAWQHAFDGVTAGTALAFQAAPQSSFFISGVPIARDALLAEAGLDLAIGRHATIGVSYTGQISSNVRDHAAKAKFLWKF